VEIAGRLAARLDAAAVREAFLDWLISEIAKLPDAAREAVTQSGGTLDAVSATALSPAEQDHARERIGAAFGAHPPISFRVDPALITGLELHGPDIVIANSWRADLSRILGDIDNVGRS
jgi:F-type H+-transporting ATPase subunit b